MGDSRLHPAAIHPGRELLHRGRACARCGTRQACGQVRAGSRLEKVIEIQRQDIVQRDPQARGVHAHEHALPGVKQPFGEPTGVGLPGEVTRLLAFLDALLDQGLHASQSADPYLRSSCLPSGGAGVI